MQELPLSRMGAAAVGGAEARPPGALARRPDGGVRDRGARPRHRGHREARARCDGPHPGARRGDGGQSGRLSFGKRPRCLGRCGVDGAGRRLRHSGHRGEVRGAFTNTVPIDAYRGAASPRPTTLSSAPSRPRRIGSAAIRPSSGGSNLIAAFPHRTAMGMAIDSGGFVANLDAAVARADTAGFAVRRAASQANGRLRGIGVACYHRDGARPADEGPTSASRGRRDDRRHRHQSNGQGHNELPEIAATRSASLPTIRYIQADTRTRHEWRRPRRRPLPAHGGTALTKAIDAELARRAPRPSSCSVEQSSSLRRRALSRYAAAATASTSRRGARRDDPATCRTARRRGSARG